MPRSCRSLLPRLDPAAFVDTSAQVASGVEAGPESGAGMNAAQRAASIAGVRSATSDAFVKAGNPVTKATP